ncbi:hypothetical protein AMTRI_Chr04g186540 [Amborella trichopoda]
MEKFIIHSIPFSEINKTFEYMLKVKLEEAKRNKLLIGG